MSLDEHSMGGLSLSVESTGNLAFTTDLPSGGDLSLENDLMSVFDGLGDEDAEQFSLFQPPNHTSATKAVQKPMGDQNVAPADSMPPPAPTGPVRSSTRVKREPAYAVDYARYQANDSNPTTNTTRGNKRKARPRPSAAERAQKEQDVRERKRLHAKHSRVRKKFLLQSLQTNKTKMERCNCALAEALLRNLPREKGKKVLEQLMQELQGNTVGVARALQKVNENEWEHGLRAGKPDAGCHASGIAGTGGIANGRTDSRGGGKPNSCATENNVSLEALSAADTALVKSISLTNHNFVVSDAIAVDNPIVYASESFYKLTGFSPQEVIGQNCRFLQGPQTDRRAVEMIRDGIAREQDVSVCLMNYKKDGTPFYNQFFLAPLRDAKGTVRNYVGVQGTVSKEHFELVKETQFEVNEVTRAHEQEQLAGS